jgi:hypothetical protein
MAGWVCRLQMLLVLASPVILGSEPRGTHDRILLSQIRDSPNLEFQVPLFISPRKRVALLYPRHWVPFLSLPTTHRAVVMISCSENHSLLYTLGSALTENTSIAKQWKSSVVAYCYSLTTGCLPIICLRGKVFTEPFLSNGHMPHNFLELARKD